MRSDWPHAPIHRLDAAGTFIVTAGTYGKQHFFRTSDRLDMLETEFFRLAREFGWEIAAWAFLSNHYHFVASSDDPRTLSTFLGKLHARTAARVNEADGVRGRRVWYQFWETQITFQKSLLARLKYVHLNPEHHGIVPNAENYRWCSAFWFRETAPPATFNTVMSFPIDRINVRDDWEVVLPETV